MKCKQELELYKAMVKRYKFDHLTGMKMRADFEVETERKLLSQKCWVVMIDVDGLHAANREQGYEAGDILILGVANAIKASKGVLEYYRIGGDEFIALYFEPIELVIPNATTAGVCSHDYNSLGEILKAVDVLVIKKKSKKSRRKED